METSDISLVHWWLKVCLSHSSFSGTPAVTICKVIVTGLKSLDADEVHLFQTFLVHAGWYLVRVPWLLKQGSGYLLQPACFSLGRISRTKWHRDHGAGCHVRCLSSASQMAKALGIHLDGDNTKCTFQHPSSSSQQIAYFWFLPLA